MSRLSEILSDDTNQFGPGTDLTISLLAVMLVIALITNHLYEVQAAAVGDGKARIKWLEEHKPKPCPPPPPPCKESEGGHFRPASEFFTAADFQAYPVTRLTNPRGTAKRIDDILREYSRLKGEYAYIFVIGHANAIDDPRARDHSAGERQKRNLEYALRRAVLVAGLMQERLDSQDLDRLIAVTTGEADLRKPEDPLSQENAWVEVMFGKEWKPPYRSPSQ